MIVHVYAQSVSASTTDSLQLQERVWTNTRWWQVYGLPPRGLYGCEASLPLVHEGGGQLWHGPHGQEHDAEEGHTKDGSGSCCGLLDAREQGANDEGHDHHLDQPAVKGKEHEA